MKKEDLIVTLIELWEEYSQSKNWWEPRDVTFLAFVQWLSSDRPHESGSPLAPFVNIPQKTK